MKYVLRFNEAVQEIPAQSGSGYEGLDRAELLALLQGAEAEGDWQLVKEITQALKREPVLSMQHLMKPGEWAPLEETVAQAKKILSELADAELKKRQREIQAEISALPPEEREAAQQEAVRKIREEFLNHPDYIEIRDQIAKKSPNWVGPFVKFRFLQGAEIGVVRDLARMLNDFRDQLDQLPMRVEDYADTVPDESGEAPGYEQLGDALNELAELRRGNWLVKALPAKAVSTEEHRRAGFTPVNLREAYRAAPKEQQIELLRVGARLAALNKPNLITAVLQNLSGRSSIEDVIKFVKQQVDSANTERGEIAERAYSAYPAVAVLYDGPDHMVFSFRNDSQLPYICAGATSWCIQPAWYNPGYADRFWSYATGSLQLGILDFSVGADNPFHTVGITVDPSGKVTSLCDQPNRCTSGGDYRQLLKGFSTASGNYRYPQELIDAIDLVFDREIKLKSTTDTFYKRLKSYSEGEKDRNAALAKTLVGLIRNIEELNKTLDPEKLKNTLSSSSQENLANQIIAREIESLKNTPESAQVREEYANKSKNQGIHSPADVSIFEIIMEGSPKFTPELLNAIINRNQSFIRVISTNMKAATPQIRAIPFYRTLELKAAALEAATVQLEELKKKITSKS